MSKGRTRRNKSKRGGYYGFSGGIATGAPNWTRHSEMGGSSLSTRGGNSMYGAGRRRRVKKHRKTKKVRRGGSKFGVVSAGFHGEGVNGMANFRGSSANKPGSATQGGFNDGGAHSLADNKNFVTTSN